MPHVPMSSGSRYGRNEADPAGFHWPRLDPLRREGKQALRRLMRDWQFSIGAIAILAIGIGANTAVFSILNSTLFQPHPFADSKRLVNLYQNDTKTGEPEGVSYPAYLDLQQESAIFDGIAADFIIEGRYQAIDAQGRSGAIRNGVFEYASPNYLDVLGMQPLLGRWFSAEEAHASAPVAVVGWAEWQRNFAADPRILGRTLYVDGTPVQVVGVGPKALLNSETNPVIAALWMPIRRLERRQATGSGDGANSLDRRDNLFLQVRARLHGNFTIQQAQAAMNVTARRFSADYPDSDPKRGITVIATDEVRVHPRIDKIMKPIAVALLIVVGLVLAIACSNLATLLLVRSSARSAEISVRLALGATRAQLVRYLLVESLILSCTGAVAGVAITSGSLGYLATIDMPLILTMQLDYRVLGFVIFIATTCGVGFGLTPALQVTRVNLAGALREEKGSSGGGLSLARGWFTTKNVLVTGQVAASFLLLVGAVLAMNIVEATQQRSVGYRPEGLAFLEVDPRYAGYDLPRSKALLQELQRQIATLPGVERVAVTSGFPGDAQFNQEFRVDVARQSESFKVEGRWAGPGYFQTLGIPVLFGQVFNEHNPMGVDESIVVSEEFARRYFGSANAVGRRFRFIGAESKPVEIIGVVGNARSIDNVSETPEPFVYRSAEQFGVMPTTLVVRAVGNESALVAMLQQEVRRLHPELPIAKAITMRQRQAMELRLLEIAVMSLGALGGLGLLLTAVGLYAVISYAVARRTNELGIRIALGARPNDLTWLVVRDVTALVIAGIAIGAALSGAGLALLHSATVQIMGVNAFALAPVVLIILLCGAAAAYLPARRAVRTDPIEAIRCQ